MSEAHARPNYGLVFMALFVMTMIEIFVANLEMAKVLIVLSLVGLAVAKALLVAMFYMHLRFEKKLLYLIAFGPLIFSIILTYGVGTDMRSNKHKIIHQPLEKTPAEH